MMLRDNASNAIKACRDWGIPHFGCIGHTLHLIVGPLFVHKKVHVQAQMMMTMAIWGILNSWMIQLIMMKRSL